MPIVVQKFGGTSVADSQKILAAARKAVLAQQAGNQVVVVVSAMGKNTDVLIDLAHEISEHPPAREMDMLLSTGEQVSVALMAMAIHALGHSAISLTGAQIGIKTDSTHTKARIQSISTERVRRALDEGKIVIAAETDTAPRRATKVDSRTRELLRGAIVPTLLRLAWPNILVMLAQASTGLIETWWVSRLGTDGLAGMALVFPVVMLMQMVSGGAMGGGISSAVARALGAGRRDEADALVMHAVVVNVALGAFFSIVMLLFGPSIYRALGGTDGELQTALSYSNVVFAGNILLWLMNGLASVIRGTGNMLVPSVVIGAGVVVLVPLSPCLIFGVGPFAARAGIPGHG